MHKSKQMKGAMTFQLIPGTNGGSTTWVHKADTALDEGVARHLKSLLELENSNLVFDSMDVLGEEDLDNPFDDDFNDEEKMEFTIEEEFMEAGDEEDAELERMLAQWEENGGGWDDVQVEGQGLDERVMLGVLDEYLETCRDVKNLPGSGEDLNQLYDTPVNAKWVSQYTFEDIPEVDTEFEKERQAKIDAQAWDCQSVLSSRVESTMEPTTISLTRKGIAKTPKLARRVVESDDDSDDLVDVVNEGERRVPGETTEQRKARKAAVKEDRKNRRLLKKRMKVAFKKL